MERTDAQWAVIEEGLPDDMSGPGKKGRPLRRYRRRWKAGRLFAWPFQFGRVVTRWKYCLELLRGLVHLASPPILLGHY